MEPPLMVLISAVYKFVFIVKDFSFSSCLSKEREVVIILSGCGGSLICSSLSTIRESVSGGGG